MLKNSGLLMATMAGLSVCLTLGCAHEDPKADRPKTQDFQVESHSPKGPPASIEAKQVAGEEQAAFVIEQKFKRASAEMSTLMKKGIRGLFQKAAAKGAISDVKVVVWADEEYPSVHTKALSQKQIELAKHRGQAIKEFLQGLNKDLEVTVINMAERPGVLSDFLSTASARVKKDFEVSGIPNTDTSVKSPSKVSRAVVMISLSARK